jgi:cytochrome b involved in lipid metabolism
LLRDYRYDLTGWINKHPGGPEAIENLCGTDATVSFSQKHGNQKKPQQTLANLLLGELVK